MRRKPCLQTRPVCCDLQWPLKFETGRRDATRWCMSPDCWSSAFIVFLVISLSFFSERRVLSLSLSILFFDTATSRYSFISKVQASLDEFPRSLDTSILYLLDISLFETEGAVRKAESSKDRRQITGFYPGSNNPAKIRIILRQHEGSRDNIWGFVVERVGCSRTAATRRCSKIHAQKYRVF